MGGGGGRSRRDDRRRRGGKGKVMLGEFAGVVDAFDVDVEVEVSAVG